MSGPRGGARVALTLLATVLFALLAPGKAHAQSAPPLRDAIFEWNESKTLLYVSLSIRDVVDADIQKKLTRGFPTTIVLTATVYKAGTTTPLATTAQSCKVKWDVWNEVFLIEITSPGRTRAQVTTTIEGVLRRCADIHRLLAGDNTQVPPGTPVYMQAKVQVNPVSPAVLAQIKRWVTRPSGTATAAPGDALFSTFTGLFLQRIGDAEHELKFTTKSAYPIIPPPPKKGKKP